MVVKISCPFFFEILFLLHTLFNSFYLFKKKVAGIHFIQKIGGQLQKFSVYGLTCNFIGMFFLHLVIGLEDYLILFC